MSKPPKKFSGEFKREVVRRMQAGESGEKLGRLLQLDPHMIRRWRREFEVHGEGAFAAAKRTPVNREAELERKIGQQQLEIDFLKKALQRAEEEVRLEAVRSGARSMRRSKSK